MSFTRNLIAQFTLTLLCLFAYSYASTLDCRFADENWGAIREFYTCTGAITNSGNNGVLLSVTGTHQPGQGNAQVTGVSIFNQRDLQRIPNNFNAFFANVAAFEWVFGDLSSITQADLAQFNALTTLSLYGNNLLQLPSNLFQSTRHLVSMDFGNNLLNYVGFNIFNNLNLQTALFQRSPCINFVAGTTEAISDLSSFMESQCRGTSQAVIDCQFAVENWLGTDTLYTCTGTIFGSSRDGIITDVTGEHIGTSTNVNVNGLSVINQRSFERIPRDIESFFPNISAFEWNFGDLVVISAEDLSQFPALRTLSVFGNRIASISSDLFQSTPNILNIDFGLNSLNHVGFNLFNGVNLRTALFQKRRDRNKNACTRKTKIKYFEALNPDIN